MKLVDDKDDLKEKDSQKVDIDKQKIRGLTFHHTLINMMKENK